MRAPVLHLVRRIVGCGAFAGDAPDLGALEFGLVEPVYGPRPAGSAPYEAVREMK